MICRNVFPMVIALALHGASAAVPTVGNVVLGGGNRATITYDLTGDPGIVTMAVETNVLNDCTGAWLPVDGVNLRNLAGDVSCVVQPGQGHRIHWRVRDTLGTALRHARVVLTAWPTNAPPDYLVVNLAGEDVPRYYTATNFFPHGFDHITYRTTNIVFKLVRAKGCSFCAGEFASVDSYAGKNPHVVHMTRDYYLGVYELTQAQYHWATGKKRPWSNDYWPDGLNYDRDYPANVGWRGNWRSGIYTDAPSEDSFVGAMRKKTGLYAELPTEAQWEFAARCGGYRRVSTQIVNGEPAAYRTVANVRAYDDTYGTTLPVGSLTPNDWGFYDMIGNVAEMCLDAVSNASGNTPDDITEETTDPHGLTTNTGTFPYRGAGARTDYGYNTTSRTTYGAGQTGYGTRIAVNLEPPTAPFVLTTAAPATAAEPTISEVTLGQDRANRNLVVTYALNKHAIVTWALETNAVANAETGWITVNEGRTNTRAWGDVNRLVEKTGGCAFAWSPDETWPDRLVAEGRARAVLTAWPTNNPPDYMVVDAVGPIVNYYVSSNAIPWGGVLNDRYRTRKIPFRKIPAKDVVWTMGVPDDVGDGAYEAFTAENRTNNTPHKVKLTYDYYVAVYELTRAQWCWVRNAYGGYGWLKSNFSLTNGLPAGGLYSGDVTGSGSFLPKLTEYHGGRYAFDIISSAEWEYAYRAGEPKTLYTGGDWKSSTSVGNVSAGVTSDLTVVGSYPPNRWGLYDMFGNVVDGIRDTTADYLYWTNRTDYLETGVCVDPVATGGTTASYKGRGCARMESWQTYQGSWFAGNQNSVGNIQGFRLMCPIPKNAE